MRVPILSALTLLALVLAGCSNADDSPTLILTPDLEATVQAAVAEALPTETPIPTPDIDATVQARLAEVSPTETPVPTPDVHATAQTRLTATATAMPTPTPTATPTPTPMPTPSPTPTPEPALYEIESVNSVAVTAEDGAVRTQFTVAVRNIGGIGGAESVPVRVQVDGGEPETAHTLERPDVGEQVSFTIAKDLELGERVVLFEIGGVRKPVDVNVVAADLEVEWIGWSIVEDGSIELTALVINNGGLAAEAVSLRVHWDSTEGSTPGRASGEVGPIAIEMVGAGDSETVVVPIAIPTGSYSLTLSAETESIEVYRDNNAEGLVEVEYVQLTPVVSQMDVLGYDREGCRSGSAAG